MIRKVMQVIFLHDMEQLKGRAKTIPLEHDEVSVGWFSDSEQVVIGYEDEKFQVYNVLSPDKPVASHVMELKNDRNLTPKVVLNDRIIILLD